MTEKHGTSIAWTHGEGFKGETWNPVTGCSKVSPGCANCYAETLTARFAGRPGYIEEHRPWTPENAEHNVRLHPERVEQPLRWKKPRMVFVNSMSDMFHESIDYHFIREVFNVMRRCDGGTVLATGKANPRHVFQILTKRPEQALALWRERKLGFEAWPDHIWLGVSIENARYTWRADVLREIPAAVRFISAEPLLGSLFEVGADYEERRKTRKVLHSDPYMNAGRAPLDLTGIDWLIVGGESGGRESRPMHPEWARELREACLGEQYGRHRVDESGPAFFFKQWGSWAPAVPEITGTLIDERGRLRDRNELSSFALPTGWTSMRYAGVSPKSGGDRLDGREWKEMPVVAR